MIFGTYYNSKSAYLVSSIIKNEDLDLSWTIVETALGDTVIEVSGNEEDVRIFKETYEMVGGN